MSTQDIIFLLSYTVIMAALLGGILFSLFKVFTLIKEFVYEELFEDDKTDIEEKHELSEQ